MYVLCVLSVCMYVLSICVCVIRMYVVCVYCLSSISMCVCMHICQGRSQTLSDGRAQIFTRHHSYNYLLVCWFIHAFIISCCLHENAQHD